jgi:hypothetical protein
VFIEATQTGKINTGNTMGEAHDGRRRTPKGHTTPQSIMPSYAW